MKNQILVAGLVAMATSSALAANITVYVVADCTKYTGSNTTVLNWCNDISLNCGSSSPTLYYAGVPTNYSYGACGVFPVKGGGAARNMLICFPQSDAAACNKYSKCGDGYGGATPSVVVSNSIDKSEVTMGTILTVTNYAAAVCCQTCTGTEPWTDTTLTGVEKGGATKICDSSGTCAGSLTGNGWGARCKAGYYDTKGYGSTTLNSAGVLSCESCATATGIPSATSAAASKAITSCYVPAGTTMTDDKGIYTYDSDCYYSN